MGSTNPRSYSTTVLAIEKFWGVAEVQLGLSALTVMGPDSIPGWGTKIMEDVWHSQIKKRKILHISGLTQLKLKLFKINYT